MRRAWVTGLLGEDVFQDRRRFELVEKGLVSWRRRHLEGKCIQYCRFHIVRMPQVNLFHGPLVSHLPCSQVTGFRVLVKRFDSRDVVALALGTERHG